MMIIGKELIGYKDKLYWVYRKVKNDSIKEGFVNDVREYWKCDLVVKNRQVDSDLLLFLREITDAELVN